MAVPPGFDPLQYAAANPDLARTFRTNAASLIGHYETFGINEGRRTTFDVLQYAAANPDVFRVYGRDSTGLLTHYITFGVDEGRPTGFDAPRYAASNPDVARVYGANAAGLIEHYLTFGISEGRSTSRFDPLLYGASNPDVARALGSDVGALTNHYLTFGINEGRQTSGFDPLLYAASNPDVARVFGANRGALTNHYLIFGADEGRQTASFDALLYAASNPDVALAFGANSSALVSHYLDFGIREGRLTNDFDPVAYLLSESDLGTVGLGPDGALRHWIQYGIREGRAGGEIFGLEQPSHAATVGGTPIDSVLTLGDRDWFQITLAAGQHQFIDLQGQGSGTGTLTDGYLRVYNAAGRLVAQDNDSGPTRDASLSFQASAAGTYYVVVAANGDAGAGTYRLDVPAGPQLGGVAFPLTDGPDTYTAPAEVRAISVWPRGGADTLTGTIRTDYYHFERITDGPDRITNFNPVDDFLTFYGGAFGTVRPPNFIEGSSPAPSVAAATFLYDTDDGRLLFDPDGTGATAAILMVTLDGAPDLSVTNLLI